MKIWKEDDEYNIFMKDLGALHLITGILWALLSIWLFYQASLVVSINYTYTFIVIIIGATLIGIFSLAKIINGYRDRILYKDNTTYTVLGYTKINILLEIMFSSG